jgi:hypothetical protein
MSATVVRSLEPYPSMYLYLVSRSYEASVQRVVRCYDIYSTVVAITCQQRDKT